MSTFSSLTIGVTVSETVVQTLDSLQPRLNPLLWFSKQCIKLSKKESSALKKIDSLKKDLLDKLGLSHDCVKIQASKCQSLMMAHGNLKSGVIEVNRTILKHTIFGRENSRHAKGAIQFLNEFITNSPDTINKMSDYIDRLSDKDRKFFKNLMINEGLSLNEDEMLFCLAHEILGHLKHNDNIKFSLKSSLIRLGFLTGAELLIRLLEAQNINFFIRISSYILSRKIASYFTSERHEKRSDLCAIKEGYLKGGIRLFKRLSLMKILLTNDNSKAINQYYTDIFTRYKSLRSTCTKSCNK